MIFSRRAAKKHAFYDVFSCRAVKKHAFYSFSSRRLAEKHVFYDVFSRRAAKKQVFYDGLSRRAVTKHAFYDCFSRTRARMGLSQPMGTDMLKVASRPDFPSSAATRRAAHLAPAILGPRDVLDHCSRRLQSHSLHRRE